MPLPSSRTSWKKRHPTTRVLSDKTGYHRNYSIDPYEGYYRVRGTMFPVGDVRRDLAAKDRVLGLAVSGKAKAYPLNWLSTHPGVLNDRIGGVAVQIEVNSEGEVVATRDGRGRPLSAVFAFWFAWQAFHPATAVFQADWTSMCD